MHQIRFQLERHDRIALPIVNMSLTPCDYVLQEFVGHMTSKGHVMQMNDVIREHVSRTRQQLRTLRRQRRQQRQ